MKLIELFSVKQINPTNDNPIKSNILLKGKKTGIEVEGDTLRYQFQVINFYLLILSSPISWGESIHFYLLDLDVNILEEFTVSGDYDDSPFLSNLAVVNFSNLAVVNFNVIEFSYLSTSDKWKLQIYEEKRLKLPKLNPYSSIKTNWVSQITTHFNLERVN